MILPDRTEDQVRVGVVIAVPPPFDAVLAAARARSGDPLAASIPPHVTLLGPTVVESADLDAVADHLARVAESVDPFVLHLRGAGSFRPVSPVVFVQVAEGRAQCEQLESGIRSGPLAHDLRWTYHPHVTVAHDIDDEALDRAFAEMADYEAQFTVDSFAAYEHGDDGVWRPVRDYPLDGGRPTDR